MRSPSMQDRGRFSVLAIKDTEPSPVLYTDPCEPVAEMDGYLFRVLSTQMGHLHDTDYPWHMNLIACSDEKYEIIYLSYHNTDVDYHTSLTDFLYEECGWKLVI